MDLAAWEVIFRDFIAKQGADDPAHDILHAERVVATAKTISATERACPEVVIPAAWLHDFVPLSKTEGERAGASKLAASRAVEFLVSKNYPQRFLDNIAHAIATHSFSAGLAPQTIEAKVVQDADRLDAIGAIGIARCLMLSGRISRTLYNPDDPFCCTRAPDDTTSALDHFFSKLLNIEAKMQTASGRAMAASRAAFLRAFLKQLKDEICPH